MLKYLFGSAAVLALSGHTALASNVIINGVPHHGNGPINVSYGGNGVACCAVEDLPHSPLPVLQHSTPSSVVTHEAAPAAISYESAPIVSHQAVPAVTYESVPVISHQAAPAVTYQSAPVITHQAAPAVTYQSKPVISHHAAPAVTSHSAPAVTYYAAPAAGRHEIIINQLPAPAPVVAAPVVAAPVARSVSAAPNAWSSRVYVGARGGLSFLEDTDFRAGGASIDNDYRDPDYTVSAVVGWAAKVNNHIQYRLEAELGYQRADVDTHSSRNFNVGSSGSDGDTQTIFGFANAYVDVPIVKRLSATVGGGLGAGYVEFDDHGIDGLGTLVDDSDTVFGYHLDAGLTYDVTDRIAVEALYRYTNFIDVGLTAEDGNSSEADIESHNVLVGARYGF